ncbi:MAG: protease modulator HflC [Planctomycetes bacterium]|nr:protease modulator HflC [Planctomycetota bacterium]
MTDAAFGAKPEIEDAMTDPAFSRSAMPLRGVGRRLLKYGFALGLCGLAVALLISSMVFVDETELVVVERLGDIVAVYDRPEDRGLRMKLPWPIDTVRRFDRRQQLFDPPGREIFTRDRKNLIVDAYLVWQVAEPPEGPFDAADPQSRPVVRFFRSLGSIETAEARLDSRLRSILSTEIGRVEFSGPEGLFHVADSESGPDASGASRLAELAETIRRQMLQRSREEESLARQFGIEVVDVRINRPNLPSGNQQAVFERMKSERKKIAQRYRSAGLAESTVIRSQARKQSNELMARAEAEAERIRGEGEAEAIRILNDAHAEDPEFYRITRTLDSYRRILNAKTTLVLSSSSNLLRLLTEGIPDDLAPPAPETPPVSHEAPPLTKGGLGGVIADDPSETESAAGVQGRPAPPAPPLVRGGTPGAAAATGGGP